MNANDTSSAAHAPRTLAGPSPAPSAASDGAPPTGALGVLLAGVFMAALDVAIVNVAAPAIQLDLGASDAGLQLVVSSYTIAYAALLVTGARLGDEHGHRRVFLLGLAGFTAASLACGLAWSAQVLVAGRIAQGVGAAAMTPQVITVIQLSLRGVARARALAIWATVISVGAVVGQVAGGVIVSADVADLSWRPIFLLNVPIGIALVAVGRSRLPHTQRRGHGQLDVGSVLLLSVTVLLVVVPLVFGRQAGWAPWTWAALLLSIPAASWLWANLRRVKRNGGRPLLDPELLHRAEITFGLGAVGAVMIAYGGFLFSLTLYLQGHRGLSPVQSGLTFAAYAVGFAITSLTVPRLPGRLQAPAPLVGLVVLSGAYTTLGVLGRDGDWPGATAIPTLLLAGAGFGAAYSTLIARTIATVPPAHAHEASGLLTTAVQLSFAVGVATIGSLYLAAPSAEHGFRQAAGLEALLALGALALAALQRHAQRAPRANARA